MPGLEDDIKSGNLAVPEKKSKSETKTPPVTKKSLRRLVNALTEEQRTWLLDLLYGIEDENETEQEEEVE